MNFPGTVYLLAVLGPALATALAVPFWRARCRRAGLVDDPGRRKIHETPMPLAGGLALMTGLLVALLGGAAAVLIAADQPFPPLDVLTLDRLRYGLGQRAPQLGAIFLGALGMLGLGWWDDKHELRPAAKFTGQFLMAVLVAAAGVRITLFVESRCFSYAVTVLWILTVTNAFNFMDNMNGLCAGLGVIGAACFAAAAAVQGQYLVAIIALATTGALLGFLPYNFPRASVFLGDAGSHLTGYLLAVLAILPHFYSQKNPRALAVLTPLLALAVPLADLAWVVVLRWRAGQPFYVGDTNHLSHRLVRRGLGQTQAVGVIWAVAAALAGLALWWN